MADFFNDPNYADRPQHEDFWKLAEAALWMDGQSEDTPIPQIVGEYVDFDSLMYLAKQRATRIPTPTSLHPLLIALYFDAFTLGARYQQRRETNR